MSRLSEFLEFLREYFRGSTGLGEYREMFICRGDPATAKVKDRGVVWIHGLDTYLTTFIRSLKMLREWNIYMGIGFLGEPSLSSLSVEKMLYDRISLDFDYEEDPDTAVSRSLEFGRYLNDRYGVTPIVFESGFKGGHVVIPLSKPVNWEVYQLMWRKLYSEIPLESRSLVDTNMLQWNRVDRVPLTYNVRDSGVRFARIIYPREFSWEDFRWRDLNPLDPSTIKLVKIITPQIVKPRIITPRARKMSWVWNVVEKGLQDGRKRFMLYVLIPYLVNYENRSEDDVLEVCKEFIDNSCRNHGNCGKIYDSWLRSVIRSSRNHGFKGFGLTKMREKDPELYNLITRTISLEEHRV